MRGIKREWLVAGKVTVNARDGSYLAGTVRLEGWGGSFTARVAVVKETAKRYRIRFLEDAPRRPAGFECYVAKDVVRFPEVKS